MQRLAIPLAVALLALAAFGLNQAFAADTTKVYLPLISCPTCTGTGTTTPPPTQTPTPGANVSRMIELVNQARAAVGCPAVTAHASMMQGAQDWTDYMASTADYRHSDGGYYEARGYPVGRIVENIGTGDTTDYAFEGWMESPAHKANIEFCLRPDNPSYSPNLIYDIGVGYRDSYWTLAIGVRNP